MNRSLLKKPRADGRREWRLDFAIFRKPSPSGSWHSRLVDRLRARLPVLTPDDARSVVNVILAAIGGALTTGNRVEIRGFGSSEFHYRNPKLGRNPKTGVNVQVPGKYRAHFKAGNPRRCGRCILTPHPAAQVFHQELRERMDYR